MAYVVKRRLFREFRQEFPQLCAASSTVAPLDFTVLKYEDEEVVKPVSLLPEGWINLRTYVRDESPEVDAHTLMYTCAQKMRKRWEKWNREHDIYIDYDNYDDGLLYEEEVEEEEEYDSDTYAEDPEDVWSD
jgi:hypothetical protein